MMQYDAILYQYIYMFIIMTIIIVVIIIIYIYIYILAKQIGQDGNLPIDNKR